MSDFCSFPPRLGYRRRMFATILRRAPALGFLATMALTSACHHNPSGAANVPTAPPAGTTPPHPASAPQLLRVSRTSQATHAERDHYLYLPAGHATSTEQRWPVILFLHGNGERGDAKADLDYLLKNGPLYEAWIQKRDLPFIIIAPQLPMYGQDERAAYLKNRRREEIPMRLDQGVPERPTEFATPQPMTGAVSEELPATTTPYGPPMGWPELEADLLNMLDDALQNQRGDAARQYLTGLSYGGFGTWHLASKHPQRFAAIAPVVGYGHPDLMPSIAAAKIPIWCFAGGRDGAVPVKYFYPGLNRLEALGHTGFRFTVEEDMGHDVWARVYAGNDVYSWFLSHQKAALGGASMAQ
jgi:pimeloyl-ACP methyl ester carboxylesterase